MKAKHSGNQVQPFPLSTSQLDAIHEREQLRQVLLERLLSLGHHQFELLMLDLLQQSGYSNVQLADRIERRGRTLRGGIDLKAYSETDISQSLTIAQIKQYKIPVPRRFVDELRSIMLRVGARHGLLITTSTFGNVARRVAADPTLPVVLIDGDGLTELLMSRQIGVRQETVQRLILDDTFFANPN